MVFETDKDDENDEQGVLNERYLQSLSAGPCYWRTRSTHRRWWTRRRIIELREDMKSHSRGALPSAAASGASVELKEQHLEEVALRRTKLLGEMRREFGVSEQALDTAVRRTLDKS